MKKLILLICMLAGMSSCYHEDALIVPEQPDKYNILTDDPSDPTQHFIYQFYQKYQTVIITNPTEADYKFNFTANNGIKITAPEQKQEIIDEGIEFLQKVLLNLYSDSFLKKNLPFSILLSEEVRMASYGETTIMNCYASSSFIALGNVSSSLKILLCVVNNQFNLTKNIYIMFSIISTMFLGIGIGYVLRNWSILQKTEKTISLTIFLLLFILGVSIGSNSLIVNNLGKFGWQAIVLAVSGVLGSLIAARLVLQLFFRKGGEQ